MLKKKSGKMQKENIKISKRKCPITKVQNLAINSMDP